MRPDTHRSCPLRLAQRGIVLLVCLSLGFHWALLQGIAWTGMLVAYASEGSVVEAVEKTFDGLHPCALCAKVKEGRDSDQKQPLPVEQSMKKMSAVLTTDIRLVAPPAKKMMFAVLRKKMVRWNEKPEPPPPRRGLV